MITTESDSTDTEINDDDDDVLLLLTESDIPGASLDGKDPTGEKCSEQIFVVELTTKLLPWSRQIRLIQCLPLTDCTLGKAWYETCPASSCTFLLLEEFLQSGTQQ